MNCFSFYIFVSTKGNQCEEFRDLLNIPKMNVFHFPKYPTEDFFMTPDMKTAFQILTVLIFPRVLKAVIYLGF